MYKQERKNNKINNNLSQRVSLVGWVCSSLVVHLMYLPNVSFQNNTSFIVLTYYANSCRDCKYIYIQVKKKKKRKQVFDILDMTVVLKYV